MEGYLVRSDKKEPGYFPLNKVTFTKCNSLQPFNDKRTVVLRTDIWEKDLKAFVNKVQVSSVTNGVHSDQKQKGLEAATSKNNVLLSIVVLVGLTTSALFLGKIIAALVENATISSETPKIASANISSEIKAARDFQNAIVRELVLPAEKPKPLPRPAKPKEIKKQIKLHAAHHRTGVSSAASDLQLIVLNQSAYFVNQVVVEVNYVKPNGKIIETDTYRVRSLRPNSFQMLFVPRSKPGAKMKYKIKNIYAAQRRSLLRIA